MKRHFSIRLVAIHALGAFSFVACLGLAYWQWDRAQAYVPLASDTVLSFEELSPLRDYLPASSVAVPTSITGTWQPDERILMPDRVVDGKAMVNPDPETELQVEWQTPIGYWVVDIMELADESSVGVVRGFTESPDQIAVASGIETVSGIMQPSEDVPGLKLVNGIKPLTTYLIVENSRTIAHDGYLVATSRTNSLTPVSPIFSEPVVKGLNWQNVAYTFNWLFFAGIVAMMWVRVARDELEFAEIAKSNADLGHDYES
ncbi:MAG: SURF1 family protein [Candidatus Nanopelagicales bacterium]